ncbi:MAG: 1,4-dihydroxy-2-naphthoate octaprenyltransferase [Wenzhouxiangella sp.]|jgi:1,4-dihydroxy-2-naphthoate octaprenyltransferase|nr:1,4-dihydroxy-2-naphthoate octaprenyltransferase [Wenzhouxiangella sp.]
MSQGETVAGGVATPNRWLLGMRPRTLTMAAVPVVTGAVLAWSEGFRVDAVTFILTLAAAVLIQIGTNLFNDASDGLRGADGPERIGPLRLTGAGLATAEQVRSAAVVCFVLALLAGVYLVWAGGLVILLIGLASLVSGYAYSSGPRPLSHGPWSEIWVIVFFGLVAVAGSYYLQALVLPDTAVLLTGLAIGAPAAAVLLVNNVRDRASDRRVGRRTLAVMVGPATARWLYAAWMVLPFALLGLAWGWGSLGLVWLALPLFVGLALRFARLPVGPAMNEQLGHTALAQLALSVLLCIEWLT